MGLLFGTMPVGWNSQMSLYISAILAGSAGRSIIKVREVSNKSKGLTVS